MLRPYSLILPGFVQGDLFLKASSLLSRTHDGTTAGPETLPAG